MNKHPLFTEADMDAVSKAVTQAEAGISGEIVPVFIDECDNYQEAPLKAFIFGVFLALLTLIVLDRLPLQVFFHQPIWFFTISLCSGLGFAALAYWCKTIKRLFIHEQQMLLRAQQKADTCFIAHQVYNTRQHTGIMIFIAFYEKTVIVKPDFAIDEKVEQSEWDAITTKIVNAIKTKQASKGIIEAIEDCGRLLKEKNFLANANDTNELNNKLRFDA